MLNEEDDQPPFGMSKFNDRAKIGLDVFFKLVSRFFLEIYWKFELKMITIELLLNSLVYFFFLQAWHSNFLLNFFSAPCQLNLLFIKSKKTIFHDVSEKNFILVEFFRFSVDFPRSTISRALCLRIHRC